MRPLYLLIQVFLILCCTLEKARGGVMEILYSESKYTKDSFFINFPFSVYSENIEIDNVRELEQDRQALNKSNYDGELFMQKYLEYTFNLRPLRLEDPDYLSDLLVLGETFRLTGRILADTTLCYEKMSDWIFDKVAAFIQKGIEDNKMSANHPVVIYWVEVLARHQYYINFPISDIEKGFHHLENKNYTYILKRILSDHIGKVILVLILWFSFSFLIFYILFKIIYNQKKKALLRKL